MKFLIGLGLEQLRFLRMLDVSHNSINNGLTDLGEMLNGMEALEVFVIRGNPCMKKYDAARETLIGSIRRMREVTCNLRVIDTDVHIGERVSAWRKSGGTEEETEHLRAQAALYLRTPRISIPESVLTLDLDGLDLKHVELSEFRSLKKLKLRSNRLMTLENLGLWTMVDLEVLDLRDNYLPNAELEKFSHYIENLHNLKYIGLSGNGFSAPKDREKYRHKLFVSLERLRSLDCPLR